MHRLWNLAGITSRDDRLALTGAIVGRQLASSNELTSIEALDVVDYLTRLDRAGQLADRAASWLATRRRAEQPEPVLVDGGAFALFDVAPPEPARPRWDL